MTTMMQRLVQFAMCIGRAVGDDGLCRGVYTVYWGEWDGVVRRRELGGCGRWGWLVGVPWHNMYCVLEWLNELAQ